jgi:hypothetical protein
MEYVGAFCAGEEWYVAIQCTEGQDRRHFAADVGAGAAPVRAGRFPIPHGTSNESAANLEGGDHCDCRNRAIGVQRGNLLPAWARRCRRPTHPGGFAGHHDGYRFADHPRHARLRMVVPCLKSAGQVPVHLGLLRTAGSHRLGDPALVVLFLGGIGWIGSHDLDPYQRLDSSNPPLEVEVVSMDWKWLFIYPDQGIASVSELIVPAGRPVHVRLISATVMNSFFIPQLGSQIYTMPGMIT